MPVSNLSDIMQVVKANSSKWINTKKFEIDFDERYLFEFYE